MPTRPRSASSAAARDARGNTVDRARRRAWPLLTFDTDLGPEAARCALQLVPGCLQVVDDSTIYVDRITPGCEGGRYVRGNIQPACGPCQDHQGGTLGSSRARAARVVADAPLF